MKILAVGTPDRLDEFRKIIPENHSAVFVSYAEEKKLNNLLPEEFDMIADLNLDEEPERINLYSSLKDKLIIGGAVKSSLKTISTHAKSNIVCHLVGFNALPTFINVVKKEISFLNGAAKEKFSLLSQQLGWEWMEVKDATGMVTPRVIMMIINEACFTLQEGTASKTDIDKGMKLGTAYPFGPFEWADRIGVRHVLETIDAIYKDNGDKRYIAASLLKSMSFKGEKFYD